MHPLSELLNIMRYRGVVIHCSLRVLRHLPRSNRISKGSGAKLHLWEKEGEGGEEGEREREREKSMNCGAGPSMNAEYPDGGALHSEFDSRDRILYFISAV